MTGPYRSAARDGRARLLRVQQDVRTTSVALTSVRSSDADAGSLILSIALRLEAEAAHLKTISRAIDVASCKSKASAKGGAKCG